MLEVAWGSSSDAKDGYYFTTTKRDTPHFSRTCYSRCTRAPGAASSRMHNLLYHWSQNIMRQLHLWISEAYLKSKYDLLHTQRFFYTSSSPSITEILTLCRVDEQTISATPLPKKVLEVLCDCLEPLQEIEVALRSLVQFV